MPPKHQNQQRGNPVKSTPSVRLQVIVPPSRSQTPEGLVQTMYAKNPHNQGAQPVATIAAAEPAQAGVSVITTPVGEALVPLPTQAVQNLITLCD